MKVPLSLVLAGVRFGENDDTCRIAVQEIAPSDRTDLTLGKKSSRRDGAKPLLHHTAIVMRTAEKSLSAPTTAEQERSEWAMFMLRSIRSQAKVQVVTCRLRIAKMKLHSLAFLNHVSDRNGSGLLIRSNEVPNEEVTLLEMTPMLINYDAQMQRAMGITSVGSAKGFEDILEPFESRHAGQFIDQVLLRSCHDKPLADRTAALRRHSPHGNRPRELHSHDASVETLIIEQQSVLSRVLASTGKTPANCSVWVAVGHKGQDFLHRRRKGIGEKEKARIFESWIRPSRHADLVLQLRHRDLQWRQLDIRKACDPNGEGGSGFNFFGTGDDTFTGTT